MGNNQEKHLTTPTLLEMGRYTHRVAISNHRLISFADGKVTFRWRDSAHNNEQKSLSLSLDEFLRRFLLHVLSKGFVRIRNFGFLANRKYATALPLCFSTARRHTTCQARDLHRQSQRSLDLPQVRWPDAGHRNVYGMRSSSVLHLPRMPSPHETTIDITEPLPALARSLSLCLLVRPISFSRYPRSSFHDTFQLSATLLLSQLGAVLSSRPSGRRQTYSSLN
jgi:hypothetical protein